MFITALNRNSSGKHTFIIHYPHGSVQRARCYPGQTSFSSLDLNIWLSIQWVIWYGALVTNWPWRGTSKGEMEVVKIKKRLRAREGWEEKEDKSTIKPTVAAWEVSKGRCFTPGSLQVYWHFFLPKYASPSLVSCVTQRAKSACRQSSHVVMWNCVCCVRGSHPALHPGCALIILLFWSVGRSSKWMGFYKFFIEKSF